MNMKYESKLKGYTYFHREKISDLLTDGLLRLNEFAVG